jgi:hypothetical protein
VNRVHIDRKKHTNHDQKHFRGLADPEPEDDQRNHCQMRDIPKHLQSRIEHQMSWTEQAVQQGEDKSDRSPNEEANNRPLRTLPQMRGHFPSDSEVKSRLHHLHRRRQDAMRN